MSEFNDRRSGKGKVDLAAKALADAKRDSVGAYGRKHPASNLTPIERDGYGKPLQLTEHHSGDVFLSRCRACRADAKKGVHPRA